MAHELLWYGLGGFGSILILVLVVCFLFRPLYRTYFYNAQGWFLLGFGIAIVLGYWMGGLFGLKICFGVGLYWLCNYSVRLIVIVGCCMLYWRITQFKQKET